MDNFLPILNSNKHYALLKDSVRTCVLEELAQVQRETDEDDTKYKHVATESNVIIRNAAKIIEMIRSGNIDGVASILNPSKAAIVDLLAVVQQNQSLRNGRLRMAIEKIVEAELLVLFFRTGKLALLSEVQPCNDEEYVIASLSMAHELSRYCKERACEGDKQSVAFCNAYLAAFNAAMVEFYFRNGPLRRKFDGLKYARKTVESVIFDLSLVPTSGSDNLEPPAKKIRADESESSTSTPEEAFSRREFVNNADLALIKARLDAYDVMRESVIKQSRDVQKLSKQAIFSLHAGKIADAQAKLVSASKTAKDILPLIVQEPGLRSGSYSNSLEEWAEGQLLFHWMEDKTIPSREALGEHIGQKLTCAEYVGALSDLTGETGRMAVVYAAKRQTTEVREILHANSVIVMGLESIESNKFGQKYKAAMTNMEKIDVLLYELCMIEKGGRVLPKETFNPDDKKYH